MLVTDVLLSINETLSGEPVFTEISMFLYNMREFSFRVSLFSFQNHSFPEELPRNEVNTHKIIDFPQTLLLILKA